VLPLDGKSYAVLVAVALGYLLTAGWYARVSRSLAPEAASPDRRPVT
jgi:hypothetical protein